MKRFQFVISLLLRKTKKYLKNYLNIGYKDFSLRRQILVVLFSSHSVDKKTLVITLALLCFICKQTIKDKRFFELQNSVEGKKIPPSIKPIRLPIGGLFYNPDGIRRQELRTGC